MRVVTFLTDSERATQTGTRLAELVADRPEDIDVIDLGVADDRDAARREAMLAVGSATRIGTKPEAIFDENGDPDFSDGAVVTVAETGRRTLRTGSDAIEALADGD